MCIILSSKITKISSKAIAMGLLYYESASKNEHIITFLGDSENNDFHHVCMYVISSSKFTKISSKAIATGLIYYESASKNTHMITFLGDSENIDFS